MDRRPLTSEPTIFQFSALGEREKAERALAASPELARAKDENGLTPLHHAAWGGYSEIIELLISAGAEVDAHDNLGRTPLVHMAPWCTRFDVVRQLLGHGADLNARDSAGNTALNLAASCIRRDGHCWGDHAGLAQMLIEIGAESDLHSAAILGRAAEVEVLLGKSAEAIDTRDEIQAFDRMGWNVVDKATALHRAAEWGQIEVCSLLLARGARPGSKDVRARLPIYLAAHDASPRKLEPTTQIIELLEPVSSHDLFTVAVLGRVETVRDLLRREPSLAGECDEAGNTPLHLALWNNKPEVAEHLIQSGAPSSSVNLRGESPSALAPNVDAGEVRDRIVSALLAKGAGFDLFTAIALRRSDLIKESLRLDPSALERRSRRGRTPLRLASEASSELVDELIGHGARLDIWTAASLGKADLVDDLLDSDIGFLNAYDNTVTPLHCAASAGHLPVVEVLVRKSAAVDPVAHDLMTPLIWAVWSGHKEVARYLASCGANVNSLDNWSKEPWISQALA